MRTVRRAAVRCGVRGCADGAYPPPRSFASTVEQTEKPRGRPENSFAMSPDSPPTLFRRPLTRDVTGAHVAVIGFPFDSATTNRPGARLGPRHIRNASGHLSKIVNWPKEFDVFDELKVVDCGDVYYEHAYPEDFIAKAEQAVTEVLNGGVIATVGLGGDHFVTYPIIRAHAAKLQRPVSLLHFDAHSDTWRSEYKGHGTMFFHAARERIVDPATSVQVGIRTFNEEDHGFRIVDARECRRLGTAGVVDVIRKRLGDNPVYVSFDVDCMDPAFAPGTGTPVAGGLSSADALDILRDLEGINIIGADVVEVSPPFDVSDITSIAASQIAHEYMHMINVRRKATGA